MSEWETLAERDLYTGASPNYGLQTVKVEYTLSPDNTHILFFSKKKGEEFERFGFSVENGEIQKLLEFLHGEVKGEFEVRSQPLWSFTDHGRKIKRMAVETYVSNILDDSRYQRDEQFVIELFKEIHEELGFEEIINLQKEFPDCTCIKDGEEVKIEFEFRSVNFKYHGHNPEKCDYVICWYDDWKKSPDNLPIISIYKVLMEKAEFTISLDSMELEELMKL